MAQEGPVASISAVDEVLAPSTDKQAINLGDLAPSAAKEIQDVGALGAKEINIGDAQAVDKEETGGTAVADALKAVFDDADRKGRDFNFEQAWLQHFPTIARHYVSRPTDTPAQPIGEVIGDLASRDALLTRQIVRNLGSFRVEQDKAATHKVLAEHSSLWQGLVKDVKEVKTKVKHWWNWFLHLKPHAKESEIHEGNGKPVLVYVNEMFQNWGMTVHHRTPMTFFPQTRVGVQNIVKWAIKNKKKVRCAGFRHSWTELFGDDGGDTVIVSFVSHEAATKLPFGNADIWVKGNDLMSIEMVDETKGLCRIGAATTNEQFRIWSNTSFHERSDKKKAWALPLNVIMTEITFGGSNGPICHGAGPNNKTLSDLVEEIEFVNAKGEIQVVSRSDYSEEAYRAAFGCFGLLGPVLSVTLRLIEMTPTTLARVTPTKPPVAKAVPIPDNYAYPLPDYLNISISAEEKKQLQEEFERNCTETFYSEFFWFPYQEKAWVNCWNRDASMTDTTLQFIQDYPGDFQSELMKAEEFAAQVANETIMHFLPGWVQGWTIGTATMMFLPGEETRVCTPVMNALHFRRGVQNMRVSDMEIEIPVPARADDPSKCDWSVVQRAWWDAIRIAESHKHDSAPLRITLEMRVMSGSEITLAPFHGNRYTCSIEVLTSPNVTDHDWEAFMQELTDAWSLYTDANGVPLLVRPHWAKQWPGQIRGQPTRDYLKHTAYKERIPEFRCGLDAVAKKKGYDLHAIRSMFSNKMLDDVLFDDDSNGNDR